ncbi:hypothetical protein ACHWQZ_G007751 [Mnemiopsis leidyi]
MRPKSEPSEKMESKSRNRAEHERFGRTLRWRKDSTVSIGSRTSESYRTPSNRKRTGPETEQRKPPTVPPSRSNDFLEKLMENIRKGFEEQKVEIGLIKQGMDHQIEALWKQCLSPKATSTTKWKIPYISEQLLNNRDIFVPFFGITETWLKGYITDAQIKIKNYSTFRSDRDSRKNGGSLLYVHNSYIVSAHRSFSDQFCNGVIVKIDDLNCITAAVYRPPDCLNPSFRKVLDSLQSFLDDVQEGNPDVFLTGDFNLPNLDWTTMKVDTSLGKAGREAAESLLEFMSRNFLSQVISQPTRNHNTLDLVLTNRVHYVCETKAEDTCLSDHKLVSVVLAYDARRNEHYSHYMKEVEDFSYFNLNLQKANFEDIREDLSRVDWNHLSELCQPDEDNSLFAELIRLTVLQTCYKHAPVKDLPKADKRPRISRPRRILHRKRKKLKGRINSLKSKNPQSSKISQLENDLSLLAFEIQASISHELNQKELKAVSCVKDNPKYFFSYAKRFSKLRSNIGPLRSKDTGLLHYDPQKMADMLQQQYSSVFSDPNNPDKRNTITSPPILTKNLSTIDFNIDDIVSAIDELSADSATSEGEIPARILKACKEPLAQALSILWKSSFETGVIPMVYKEQFITPVYKKGNKTDPANYRPISLTSHVIKIFERVIRKNLVEYLEINNLFSSKQHGFRKGRSCLTQLLQHMDYLLENFLDNSETDVIYLDYAKAFDKVDHSILLEKIKAYGIDGKLFEWIKQFLCGRSQTVVVDGKKSISMPVISGVPQGTVLGPILFLLYVNDMDKNIKSSKINSFADDTRISKRISNLNDCTLLQEDLEYVIEWSKENNMLLHEDKFEFLSYRTPASKTIAEALPFMADVNNYTTSNGTTLDKSSLVRDLGVIMSEDLSWSPHINLMVDQANQIASWVLGVFKDRTKPVMMQLYKSLIRSRVEYCCPLWNPTKIADIHAIESIQRNFTRRISGLKNMNYWDRLKELNLSSLQRRRERYMIIHVWKILHGVCPNDIKMVFKDNSRLGTKVVVPPLTKTATALAKTLYDNSFGVKAGRLWNTLPRDVNTQCKLECFKAKLGSYLDSFPDNPPTPGYTASNPNSLIDWFSQRGGPQMARWP